MSVLDLPTELTASIERERNAVAARVEAVRLQADRLRVMLADLDREVAEQARLLRSMDELLGRSPQLALYAFTDELRGRRLCEVAIQVLRDRKGAGQAVHYREWYELVTDAGGRVAGRDPLAAFLTQVSRAPEVESVRPRSGLYRLRAV